MDTLLVRAYARRMGADAEGALADLETALGVAREHDLGRRTVDVEQDLGATLYHHAERRPEATAWIAGAVAGYDALGEHGRAAVARSWVGVTLFRVDPEGAKSILDEAARLAEAHAGTPEQVLVVSRRFLNALDGQRLDEARTMSKRAFAWHDRLGSHHDCCSNLVSLGVVELSAGQFDAAGAAALASLERTAQLDAPGLVAAVDLLRAAVRAARATEPIDGLSPARWYARQAAPLFQPGPPDERHPDGAPPLAKTSIWCDLVVTYVGRYVGLSAGSEPESVDGAKI